MRSRLSSIDQEKKKIESKLRILEKEQKASQNSVNHKFILIGGRQGCQQFPLELVESLPSKLYNRMNLVEMLSKRSKTSMFP